MSEMWTKYFNRKKLLISDTARRARTLKFCYLFLLPYAVLFITFKVLPVVTSIYYSFTNFNILEKPEFIGLRNYINLFLEDEVFQQSEAEPYFSAAVPQPRTGQRPFGALCPAQPHRKESGGHHRQ